MGLVRRVRAGEKIEIGTAVVQVFPVSGQREQFSVNVDAPLDIPINFENAKKREPFPAQEVLPPREPVGDRKPLTKRQAQMFSYIAQRFINELSWPTTGELCTVMGINSRNGIVAHLTPLEAKGWIDRSSEVRGIRLAGIFDEPNKLDPVGYTTRLLQEASQYLQGEGEANDEAC
jgi:antitoxin (DNA-binding transcriptional repressor) of toxin-antitoxin stability system